MNTEERLLKRPIEEDTLVIAQVIVRFEEIVGLFEKWSWDGISAKSLIFLKDDFNNFNNKEFIPKLFDQMKMDYDPNLTFKESGEYVFINFGFEVE